MFQLFQPFNFVHQTLPFVRVFTMILFDSVSSVIAPNPDTILQLKPLVVTHRTRRRIQRLHQPPLTAQLSVVVAFTIMFLNRRCCGDMLGTLNLRSSRRYNRLISLQLKHTTTQTSCGKIITSELLRARHNRKSAGDTSTRPYSTLYQNNCFEPSSVRHTIAFITSPSRYHHHQQHSFASTQTKSPRSANRWRSPILRAPVAAPGDKRPPKLYKRLHNIRGKKNSSDDDTVGTILDDGKLYRADRVLANRTGKSRKDCFQLLQERRVFMVTDQLYHDVSPKSGKTKGSPPMLDHSSNTTDSLSQNVDTATMNDDDNINSMKKESKNVVQQYRLEVITGPAIKIGMHTKLRIDKYQDVPLPPPLLMIYHKPKWVLSVRRDPIGRPCLNDVLLGGSDESSTNPNAVPPLHPVGRLDYDTTGLLLFSSSGPLTQALLHPKYSIEKEYVAVVTGVVNEEELRTVLAAGVTTGNGVHTAQLVSAVPNTPPSDDVATFLATIKSGLPSEYNTTDLKLRGYLDVFDATSLSTVTLKVSEGKYRMVRRMLANVGHPVVTLHRARLGEITLGDLPVGHTRTLTTTELKWAQKQLKQGGKVLNPTKPKDKPTQAYDSDDDEFNATI